MFWNWDLRISKSDLSYLVSGLARSVLGRVWLDRLNEYFEPCNHSFPPYCHVSSLTTSSLVALSFKALHSRWHLSHPQPFTHAKTTMVSQHGCHLHPPCTLFRVVEGETTCRETQKNKRRKHEEQLFLE